MTDEQLIETAAAVAANAYCPYSRFRVGAALAATDGRIFTGVNVENASYGLTLCAERAAVCAAITAGVRTFTAIAIFTDSPVPTAPCGACRQMLVEFASADMRILLAATGTPAQKTVFLLHEMLPHAFTLVHT